MNIRFPFLAALLAVLFTACSTDDEEDLEFADWQQRNEAYFASLADSLRAKPSEWLRIKKYSLVDSVEAAADEYVYVRKLKMSESDECPMSTDSVRVIYEGRLIPSATYPTGYVFDGTVYNGFDSSRNGNTKFLLSAMNDGFLTALLHMHRGDEWRIFVPAKLGYGSTANGSIPAHSTLIFDVALIDFAPAGHALDPWN